MAKGVLTYPKTGEVFKSLHKLSSEDFLHVARIAKYVLRLDKVTHFVGSFNSEQNTRYLKF